VHHLQRVNWLVNLAKEEGVATPKTVIFCNTINDVSAVVNYLVCKLESALFSPPGSRLPEDSILGIYHSNSWQSTKDLVIKSLKGNGKKRIVVATTALCMGVNFPDLRYIINWGPARTIGMAIWHMFWSFIMDSRLLHVKRKSRTLFEQPDA
jgi:superfamily II DNA/RNA helicase